MSIVVELYNPLVAHVTSVREIFQTYEDAAKETFIDCNKISEFKNKKSKQKNILMNPVIQDIHLIAKTILKLIRFM